VPPLLHGVGVYAADAHAMFCEGLMGVAPRWGLFQLSSVDPQLESAWLCLNPSAYKREKIVSSLCFRNATCTATPRDHALRWWYAWAIERNESRRRATARRRSLGGGE
jgi:hypothetical protein